MAASRCAPCATAVCCRSSWVGYLAFSLGLRDAPLPCRPADLVRGFRLDVIGRDDWVWPEASGLPQ